PRGRRAQRHEQQPPPRKGPGQLGSGRHADHGGGHGHQGPNVQPGVEGGHQRRGTMDEPPSSEMSNQHDPSPERDAARFPEPAPKPGPARRRLSGAFPSLGRPRFTPVPANRVAPGTLLDGHGSKGRAPFAIIGAPDTRPGGRLESSADRKKSPNSTA